MITKIILALIMVLILALAIYAAIEFFKQYIASDELEDL